MEIEQLNFDEQVTSCLLFSYPLDYLVKHTICAKEIEECELSTTDMLT